MTSEQLLSKIHEIDSLIYGKCNTTQFTIDMVSDFENGIKEYMTGEMTDINFETLCGSLSYQAGNALEICNKSLYDYEIIQKLYNAVNNKEY